MSSRKGVLLARAKKEAAERSRAAVGKHSRKINEEDEAEDDDAEAEEEEEEDNNNGT